MKKLILIMCLFAGIASATEYSTLYNTSGVPVHLRISSVDGVVTGYAIVLVEGGTHFIPRDSVITMYDSTWMNFFFEGNADRPIVYMGAGGTEFVTAGEWYNSMIPQGFAIGCGIAGYMLLLHILQLLRKPVIEN